MSKKTEYEVGYKKPPKSGQFKPGQSGNRKGRPKKNISGKSIFEKHFMKPEKIQIRGETVYANGLEISFLKFKEAAFKGERWAIQLSMQLAEKYGYDREFQHIPAFLPSRSEIIDSIKDD